MHGPAVLFITDGSEEIGDFEEGKWQGVHIHTYSERRFEVTWEKGRKVSEKKI